MSCDFCDQHSYSEHSTQDPEKSGQGRESSPPPALWSKRAKGAKVKASKLSLILT
ncbi:MAG: hypothetical protein RIS09_609, partial [Actinomycetota bacterium]